MKQVGGVVKCSEFVCTDEQMSRIGGKRWQVTRLFQLAKKLPVYEVPTVAVVSSDVYTQLTLRQFVGHMKAVLNADMSYPIILSADGDIMDGRHRLMRAILEERPTIKLVRFEKTPDADREE